MSEPSKEALEAARNIVGRILRQEGQPYEIVKAAEEYYGPDIAALFDAHFAAGIQVDDPLRSAMKTHLIVLLDAARERGKADERARVVRFARSEAEKSWALDDETSEDLYHKHCGDAADWFANAYARGAHEEKQT